VAHRIVMTGRAIRDLDSVPPRVVPAIVEFLYGPLAENPRPCGKPLTRDLAGTSSAHRGAYRVLYEIDDDAERVAITRVDHRADVYRP
jgi:mRNA interferase RelE/StbE